MRLRLGSRQPNPIAIDLGWSSVKLLQLEGGRIEAADEVPIPEVVGEDWAGRLECLEASLHHVVHEGVFKGRRVVVSMPTTETLLQLVEIDPAAGVDDEVAMRMCLPEQAGDWMVRPIDVSTGQAGPRWVICQAICRAAVLDTVKMLHRCKLQVDSVVAQPRPMLAAFDHINRRQEDADACTMFVDIGAGGTTVVMAHGQRLVLARSIAVGGRHFDGRITDILHCTPVAARHHRLQPAVITPGPESPSGAVLRTPGRTEAQPAVLALDRRSGAASPTLGSDLDGVPVVAAHVDLSVLVEGIVDELQLCLRHHAAAFPHVDVTRVIFTGGEARQAWLQRKYSKEVLKEFFRNSAGMP